MISNVIVQVVEDAVQVVVVYVIYVVLEVFTRTKGRTPNFRFADPVKRSSMIVFPDKR